MKSSTTPDFWKSYARLSTPLKERARRVYRVWKSNPRHPSLCFNKVGHLWSIRIDAGCRAVGLQEGDTLYWFWIGDHDEYEKLIAQS